MSSFARRCRWPVTLFAAILTMTCLLAAKDGAAATFTLQAEDGEVVRGLSASNRSGFIGTGFVDLVNEPGSYVEWVIDISDAAAASTLAFRFANGATTHRKLKILVNGVLALPGNLICPPTGSWSTWRTKTVTGVTLRKGLNSIRVESVTATAAPNLDQVVVTTEAQLTLLDWAQAIIHSTIDVRYPDPALLGAADSRGTNWRYQHGLFLLGLYRAYQRTGDARMLTFIKGWMDVRTDPATGGLLPDKTTDPGLKAVDTIMPGRVALLLDGEFGDPTAASRYRLTADRLWNALAIHKRTPDRIFWHNNSAKNTVLLDGAYMALPFAISYGNRFGQNLPGALDIYHDVAGQLLRHRYHLQDIPGTEVSPSTDTGLFYHAYDLEGDGSNNGVDWTEGTAKHSSVIWCRAMGWYAMAVVDVLELMPPDAEHRADREALVVSLQALLRGLAARQSSDGRWLTVPEYPARPVVDNFLDSSCSAMFVYAISKGIVAQYLDRSFSKVASKAYKGVLGQLALKPEQLAGGIEYLTFLDGIAAGQLVQSTPELYTTSTYGSDGSIVPRLNPLTNDLHGLGAFLLMYEQVKKNPWSISLF